VNSPIPKRVPAIGQALLDRKLSADRPVAILSGDDIDHALLALAARHVGLPYAPIAPAYSLVSFDHARLKYIMGLLTHGLVFAANGEQFAGSDVDRAHESVGSDHVAKILFTSGSTGAPEGVINTQRMLCHNQQMILQSLSHYGEVSPIRLDWLPWHHPVGGNNDFDLMLYNGGTLYIDERWPQPDLIGPTVRNLREIATTAYISVPRGYEALLPYLHEDSTLRERFFSRLEFMFDAGAALSQLTRMERQRRTRRADLRRTNRLDHQTGIDRDGSVCNVHQPRRDARLDDRA